jgi:hypothetical protein
MTSDREKEPLLTTNHVTESQVIEGHAGVQSPVNDPFLEAHEYFPQTGASTPSTRFSQQSPTDYDSDTSSSSDEPVRVAPTPTSTWRFHIPPLYRNILKCSIAYFIGSLFTFTPYLSGFISDITSYGPEQRGPSPSGHMVATV